MSSLTIILLMSLAATLSWLLWGGLGLGDRRAAREVPSSVDRTATLLFDRWAGRD